MEGWREEGRERGGGRASECEGECGKCNCYDI